MDKEKKKQIAMVVLLVVAALVVVYQFLGPGTATPPPPGDGKTPASTTANTPASSGTTRAAAPRSGGRGLTARQDTRLQSVEVNADQLLEGIQQVQFDYSRERTSRNPMEPLVGRTQVSRGALEAGMTVSSLRDVSLKRVTGIVFDDISPAAVVDDEVVSVGHTYDNGVRVYAIEPSRVIFLVGDSLVPVELKEFGL